MSKMFWQEDNYDMFISIYINDELEKAKTKGELLDALEKDGADTEEGKAEYLRNYMHILNQLTKEDLDYLIKTFLEGSWRERTIKYKLIEILERKKQQNPN